jgi:hypothetical protein
MDKVIAFVLIFLTLLAFTGLGVSIAHGAKEQERLIAQCIDDGRKEYECRTMLQTGWE